MNLDGFLEVQNRAGAEFELGRRPKIWKSPRSAGRTIHRWKRKILCSRNFKYAGFLDNKLMWKSDVEICLQELSSIHTIVFFLAIVALCGSGCHCHVNKVAEKVLSGTSKLEF